MNETEKMEFIVALAFYWTHNQLGVYIDEYSTVKPLMHCDTQVRHHKIKLDEQTGTIKNVLL